MLICRFLPRPTRSTAVRVRPASNRWLPSLTVVNPPRRHTTEDPEAVPVGIEQHLMGLQRMRAQQEGPADRLSPLGLKHINMLGRYAFTLPDSVARGELRPLRNPSNADGDDA